MISRAVVVLANDDATREALQLLAGARIPVTLAHPSPELTLPLPARHAANGRRYRLEDLTLSDREVQVLQLMSEGNSNKEIGAQLDLACSTICSHTKRIFRKLDVDDRAHAVIVGLRAGLIEVPA